MKYIFIVDYISIDRQYIIDKGNIVELIKVIKYRDLPSIAVIYNPLLKTKEIAIPLLDLMFCTREYKGD